MSRETERILRELEKYLSGKEINNDIEYQKAVDEFMMTHNSKTPKKRRKDAWDYLDMAYEADSDQEALKYAQKALQLDKDCIDAEAMIAELTAEDGEELKLIYEKLIAKTEKRLKEKDVLNDENIGHFWGILETRPYMRLRFTYLQHLIDQGKLRKAVKECEDLLLLSENDNLGVRYILISLYAFFEDEINVNKLYKKFDYESSVHMLLPIAALYYKLDNYKKAELYLKKLDKVTDKLEEVFCNEDCFDDWDIDDVIDQGIYQYGSKDEIMVAMADSSFLYSTTAGLFSWIAQRLGA